MSFLRTIRQPSLRSVSRQTPTVAFTSRRHATQDYGSGAGNPAGENPQDQPKNPKEHMEHPGPEAPSVGKSNSGSSSGQQQQQGGEQKSSTPDKSSKGTQGAQPKIFSASPPSDGEASQDVKNHNKDMDNRAEKEKVSSKDAEKDKVGKKFWVSISDGLGCGLSATVLTNALVRNRRCRRRVNMGLPSCVPASCMYCLYHHHVASCTNTHDPASGVRQGRYIEILANCMLTCCRLACRLQDVS